MLRKLIHRRSTRFFSLGGLCLISLLLATPSLFAHTHPMAMMPAADSTGSSPASVMIHFSGPLEPKFSLVTVIDKTGHVVNKDASVVAADAKSISLAMPALPPGIYTVKWVAVSVDSHREQGEYKFTVK
jgi:methionine-rich copper-binding protein CopC